MDYELILTRGERRAIDWVGYRYFHGDDLYNLLAKSPVTHSAVNAEEEDFWWQGDYDIKFEIPEHIAWEIKDGIEDEDCELSCFSEPLKEKLLRFIESII